MQNKGNTDYYSIICGLPDISLEQNSDPDFSNLVKTYADYISPRDRAWLQLAYEPIDLQNFLNTLFNASLPWVHGGTYSSSEIEEAVSRKTNLFAYQDEFFDHFENSPTEHPRAAVEKKLLKLYYLHLEQCGNQFLAKWGRISLALKNYVILLYGEHLHLDVNDSVIEDAYFDKTNIRTLEQYLNEIMRTSGVADVISRRDIAIKEKYIDQLLWDYLTAATFFAYFSLEKLIAFALQNQLANRWKSLQKTAESHTPELLLNTIIENKYAQ